MLIIKSRRRAVVVRGSQSNNSVISPPPSSSSPLLLLLFLFFSPCSLLLLLSSFSPATSSSSAPRCTVNDAGRTPGECTHIRKCRYQIGRLRVGATVTNCPGSGSGGRGDVCCPKGMSISEMKCLQWREMLYAPGSFDQPRFTTPMCGIGGPFRQFIVGGRDALPFEYPHSVALGYGSDMNRLKFLCGATLISERFLLTAAHCVTNKNVGKPTYAVIGDIILDPKKVRGSGSGMKASGYRKIVRIANHIVHPQYKPPLIYNDIALLQLSSPLELDRYILPACVGNPLTSPKRNSAVEASGWGITDAASSSTSNTLQAINITMIEGDTCNQIYGLEADKGFRYPQGIVKSQLCATGEDKDTCRGDSGGGLYKREGSCLFHLVGITSIGSKVCGLGNPAVYTTVAAYQDWIESTVWGGGGGGRQ